jgi:hypothetical protein
MVTLVNNKVTVLADTIVDDTLLHQTLNDGDVHSSPEFAVTASGAAFGSSNGSSRERH